MGIRIFAAPGNKKIPPPQTKLSGTGGIGNFFNKIVNAAYAPLKWMDVFKPTKVTRINPKTTKLKGSSLTGGRRRRHHREKRVGG